MPVLDWLGKDKVINHHLDVPFRFLDKKFSVGNSDNKIIHGDNLFALKSLLPEFAGRVKCIYIDPPYNTGNEGRIYNGLLQKLLSNDGAIFISIDDNELANHFRIREQVDKRADYKFNDGKFLRRRGIKLQLAVTNSNAGKFVCDLCGDMYACRFRA